MKATKITFSKMTKEEKPQLKVYAGGSVSKLDKHGQPTTCVANISFKDDGRKMLSVGFGAEAKRTGINVAAIWHKTAELEATILAAIDEVTA